METQEIQTFLEKAEDRLAGIRGSLLLFAQGRLAGAEITPACMKLAQFQFEAEGVGLADVGGLAGEAAYSIEHLSRCPPQDRAMATNDALDLVSQLEAALLQMPLSSDEFLADADALVESSFQSLGVSNNASSESSSDSFEIDDDTLEIFREEAEGLLANMNAAVEALRGAAPASTALWELRRHAHTFKGAAGIVGMDQPSRLAHAIEDLLDRMVTSGAEPDQKTIDVLHEAVSMLDTMSSGRPVGVDAEQRVFANLKKIGAAFGTDGSAEPQTAKVTNVVDVIHTPPTPVVRVSLDRLDALMELSETLIAESEMIAKSIVAGASPELSSLVARQHQLATEMRSGLQQIRMVRFGVLQMRLNRAVHVTCQDEEKKAEVVICDPDVEVDTLVIDALIEPLLHLLKNAVVHGIERPETRRMVGKPEAGTIAIRIASDDEGVTLSVEDDGRGISTAKLIEKAIANGSLDRTAVDSLEDSDAYQLIFERGLTTADSVNMNAGRGVGMSIVKESIESRRGTVMVASKLQQGTRFTLTIPTRAAAAEITTVRSDRDQLLVLVVDDSNSVRTMTSRVVEASGGRVITAVNGADALELLLAGTVHPDLILSDVEMPVMDGWEFLEYVKTDENLGQIPVVMVTSLSNAEYREKASRLGAADYVVKPISKDDLERVIETIAIAQPA